MEQNTKFDIFSQEAESIWKDPRSRICDAEGRVIKQFGESKSVSAMLAVQNNYQPKS